MDYYDLRGSEGLNDVPSEELEQNLCPVAFWKLVCSKLKDHIDHELPSFEFDALEDEQNAAQSVEGTLAVNRSKNRYMNVLANDSTRVHLKKHSEDGSDYVNANFVGGEGQYIAAQAPTPDTLQHFWQMIVEQKCSTIVMLTREYEGEKVKSHRYWPEEGSETFGEFQVELTSEDPNDGFIMREMKVRWEGIEHRVTQFHFLTWPDHSVPNDPKAFMELLHAVDQLRTLTPEDHSPIIVHCSAGIGRTGTFCMVHTALHYLNGACAVGRLPPISLLDVLRQFRKQRCGMVTQRCQYLFCYEALLDEANRIHKALSRQQSAQL